MRITNIKYLKTPLLISLGFLIPLMFICWSIYLILLVHNTQADISRLSEMGQKLIAVDERLFELQNAISTANARSPKSAVKDEWEKSYALLLNEIDVASKEAGNHKLTDITNYLTQIKLQASNTNAVFIKILEQANDKSFEYHLLEDQARLACNEAVSASRESLKGIRLRQRANTYVLVNRQHQFNYIVIISCLFSLFSFIVFVLYRNDIAKRKQAEIKLQASEEKFSKAFSSSPYPLLIVNLANNRIIDVNRQFLNISGYERDELIGHSTLKFNFWVDPEDRNRFLQFSKKEAGRVAAFETLVRHKNGTARNAVLSSEVIEIEGERSILIALNDVTEQRQSEEALRESEERFYKAFQSNPYPMAIADLATGVFVNVNESFASHLGYKREEIIGSTAAEINMWHSLKDRETFLGELKTKGLVRDFEGKLRNKKGQINSYLHSVNVIEIGGKKKILGAFIDITERKRSQERQSLQYALTRIFSTAESIDEAMPQILQTTCENLGWDSGERWYVEEKEELLRFGDIWYSSVLSDVEKILPAIKRQTFTKGTGFTGNAWALEQPVWSSDISKDPRTLRVSAAELLGIHGATAFPIFANKTITDVLGFYSKECREPDEQMLEMVSYLGQQIGQFIERKQAEAALRESEERLQHSQKIEAVGRLAGGIAHDFNNILTAITGYSDLTLRKLAEDSPLRHNIEEVKRAAMRAASLTSQLLAFSRKSVMQPKTLNLNETVAHVDEMLKRLLGEDIHLRTFLEPKLSPVKTDPTQIELALLNLAVNARDAMPNGGRMTIETSNVVLDETYTKEYSELQPGNYVMIAVSDTGHGMDEETQSHIFEPFFTTKPKGKGTGLGLSTVYGIVKQSKGHISFYTERDKGTTFKVYLPCVQDEKVTPTNNTSGQNLLMNGWETILLVEDDNAVRAATKEILKMCGYNVIEATDGLAALDVCANYKQPIHLVLTDVVMPRMNGSELASRLSNLLPRSKILFMSGYTDDAIIHHGVMEEGINFIEKPFTPVALAKKIKDVLS